MFIANWDFNKNFQWNAKNNLFCEMMGNSVSSKGNREILTAIGFDGQFIGSKEFKPYISNTYGNEKPMCLGDKIIRELHRVLLQINAELDRFVNDVDDYLDSIIPGWEELGGVWSTFQYEVLTKFENEVLKPAEDILKDAWNGFTNWISDPC